MQTFDTCINVIVDGKPIAVTDSIQIPMKGISIKADGFNWTIEVNKKKEEGTK